MVDDGEFEPGDEEFTEQDPEWEQGSLAWWFGVGKGGRSPFRRVVGGIAAVVCLIWALIVIWPGPNGLNQYFDWAGLAESRGEQKEPVPSKPINTLGRDVGESPCPDEGPVVVTDSDFERFGQITIGESCEYVVRGVDVRVMKGPALSVYEDGEVTIENSSFVVRWGGAVSVTDPDAPTRIEGSRIRSEEGEGLQVQRAKVEVTDSWIGGQPAIDAWSEAHIELTDTEVSGPVERANDATVRGASKELDRRQAMEKFVEHQRRSVCTALRPCLKKHDADPAPTHFRVVARIDKTGEATEVGTKAVEVPDAVLECTRRRARQMTIDDYPHEAPGYVDCHLPDGNEQFADYQFQFDETMSGITRRSLRRVMAD